MICDCRGGQLESIATGKNLPQIRQEEKEVTPTDGLG